jgi:hypothetical protein
MVVGKETYMKRANRNQNFDGYEAGIVVQRGDEYVHKTGQAVYPNEQLLGGWAKVYRKDISRPIEIEVSMQEFSKGQSTWKQQPGNMIRKVALVNALREAFPEDLGALHTEEEPNPEVQNQTEIADVTPQSGKAEELLAEFVPEAAAEPIEVIEADPFAEHLEADSEDGEQNGNTQP